MPVNQSGMDLETKQESEMVGRLVVLFMYDKTHTQILVGKLVDHKG